jgi:hypothetical protein
VTPSIDISLSLAIMHYCSPSLNSFTLILAPQSLLPILGARVLDLLHDRYAKLDDGSPFGEKTRLASQLSGWLKAVSPSSTFQW